MIRILLDDGLVTMYERESLSLSQILVLACMRRLGSQQQTARFLRRSESAIAMIVFRLKEKGFLIHGA